MIPLPGNNNSADYLKPVSSQQKIAPPRADFINDRFNTLIAQKGVDVLVEKAIQCPCKTRSINALSTCRNCGGTGWIFVNKRESRFVLQSMNFENKEEVWSRMVHGIVKITAPAEENLAFMDRITRLNANSIMSEVIEFDEYQNNVFGFLTYEPKNIEYMGIYPVNPSDPLIPYNISDIEINGNKITLRNTSNLPNFDKNNPLTATFRYVHAPTFNIVEHQREEIDNYKWNGKGETLQYLPTLAIARRTQDLDDLNKLRSGDLNDNSYDDSKCYPNNIYKPTCK